MLKKLQSSTILYATSKNIELFKGETEEQFPIKTGCEQLQIPPKDRICLVIDRCQQDLKEEKLPSLPFWDRLRILFHKKASCVSQGGYAKFSLFKEEGNFYLRWIHILPSDPLYPWISLTQSHSGKVLFAELEAISFLKRHEPAKTLYQLLCYSVPGGETRHIIFKGRRDFKKSLYFLSRHFPDIEHNIQPVTSTLKDFLIFISSQKKASLCLKNFSDFKKSFVRAGVISCFSLTCLGSGVEIYRGYEFRNETRCLLDKIKKVEFSLKKIQGTSYDGGSFRKALEAYVAIQSYTENPLKEFEKLANLLKNKPIILEEIKWSHEKTKEITLSFFIEEEVFSKVTAHFESILLTLRKAFPSAHLAVVTAPFNSGEHEVFKGIPEMTLPRASLHIRFP